MTTIFRALTSGLTTAFALLGGVAAPAAAETGVTDKAITIGQTITLEGGKNAYGVAAQQSAKLYIDQVNAAGGVHGRKIVLRTLDDDNKASTAQANARELVKGGAFLLFGSIEGGLEGFMTAKALVLALQAAGRKLSRAGLVRALEAGSFDLGGVQTRYRGGDHEGSRFVDLSMVARDGRFLH